MRITSKGEYGIRAMLELAIHYGQGPISISAIAKKQEISEHYLEHLFASLRDAGLITSFRGAHGGYELARAPEEISIGDIIRVLEGPIAPMDCVAKDPVFCTRMGNCATRVLWKKLQTSMEKVLESTTLAWLYEEAKKFDAEDDSLCNASITKSNEE